MADKRKYNRKESLTQISQKLFDIGKLPPQAIDLEEAVLGSLMLDRDTVSAVMDILSPESFYKESHQHIFKCIEGLFRDAQPIDILTVTQAMRKCGQLEQAGGAYFISQLTNRVASSANSEFHARIIQQKHMMRELIKTSTEVIRKCYDEESDVFETLEGAQTNLNDITANNIRSQEMDATKAFGSLIKHIEVASQNKEDITGIPCTIPSINRLTNGWQDGNLIIIGGRPSMGKTAFTKSIIVGAIKSQAPVIMFSVEQSTLEIMSRIMSEEIGLTSQDLLKGKVSPEHFPLMNNALGKYYTQSNESLFFIDDSPTISINELKAKAKRIVNKNAVFRKAGRGLIIVDYLQKVDGTNPDKNQRHLEIKEVSKGLKTLARELSMPVIALCSLSRAVESTKDKRPNLGHLRESGDIEQDADLVGFLYRPEYYFEKGDKDLEFVEHRGQIIPCYGFTEFIVQKHRNGALSTLPMRFNGPLTKFTDWDEPEPPSNSPRIEPPDNPKSPVIIPNQDFLKGNDFTFTDPPF